MRKLVARLRARMALNARHGAAVRRSLVQTLYASPTSLTIGAIAGVALSIVVAIESDSRMITLLAVTICTVAWLRVVSAIYFHRELSASDENASRAWELAYELGAWAYAAMLGVLAFTTLLLVPDPAVQILSVSLAAGYAGGISGRNAGRVHIAIGQTCLTLLPTCAGLFMSGDTGYAVLGGVLFLMIFGMADISATTHRIVLEALEGKHQKSELAAKFERLARFDSLTGVENRMAMQMRLRDLFEGSRRDRDALAVLWLDLDRFKEINDSLGHIVGDQLLCKVAERLAAVVERRGHVARFGGDEFVLICPEVDRVGANDIAEEIIAAFADGFDVGAHNLAITTSVGIAIGPQDGRDSDELLQHADLALYRAKHGGRNRADAFTWGMKERFNRLHDIESGLRTAIDNGELAVHFQPIFDVTTGAIASCEALLRWKHPVLGDVSPGEFIPIAETTSMIAPITEWVLRQSCMAAVGWPGETRVAVNISPALIKSSDLPAAVIAALLSSGLPARRLELEVTESVFLEESRQTSQTLLELQKIGLRLALDDFGTGYSSLSYLRSYPFDTIKVDQSFMKGIGNSEEDRAIVQAVASLARRLNMETVAEGIETDEQMGYARDAGFTNVQGFHLCRPLDPDSLSALMAGGGPAMGQLPGTFRRRA